MVIGGEPNQRHFLFSQNIPTTTEGIVLTIKLRIRFFFSLSILPKIVIDWVPYVLVSKKKD